MCSLNLRIFLVHIAGLASQWTELRVRNECPRQLKHYISCFYRKWECKYRTNIFGAKQSMSIETIKLLSLLM